MFAYGALLHAVILHTGLRRKAVVATMAASLTGMGFFKIAGYAWHGFDYSPYLQIIAFSIIAAIIGTWIGRLLIERISETLFRKVFRLLVTVMALRMLYVAVAGAGGA